MPLCIGCAASNIAKSALYANKQAIAHLLDTFKLIVPLRKHMTTVSSYR